MDIICLCSAKTNIKVMFCIYKLTNLWYLNTINNQNYRFVSLFNILDLYCDISFSKISYIDNFK